MNYWRSLIPALGVFAISACSGGSSDRTVAQIETSASAASVSLSASQTVVAPGGSVLLTWSTTNATSCEASGGWSGDKALSGSITIPGITEDTRFRLSCSGANGGGLAEITIQANLNGPSVSLRASPQEVAVDETTTLIWESSNATSCTAAGAWSGAQPISGSFVTSPLTEQTTYRLTCDGPGGNAVAMVSVRVLTRTISWQAPTETVDGEPLTNLTGFIVYWGTQSRAYTGNHTINSAGATEWDATVSPGPYYFAVTALDSDGNESDYSNEILKTIP